MHQEGEGRLKAGTKLTTICFKEVHTITCQENDLQHEQCHSKQEHRSCPFTHRLLQFMSLKLKWKLTTTKHRNTDFHFLFSVSCRRVTVLWCDDSAGINENKKMDVIKHQNCLSQMTLFCMISSLFLKMWDLAKVSNFLPSTSQIFLATVTKGLLGLVYLLYLVPIHNKNHLVTLDMTCRAGLDKTL